VAAHREIPLLRDLRYQLEYVGLRLLIGFVRLFPVDIAGNISARIWRLVAPYNRRHKRALANLERAFPDMAPEERERIARDMWENLGRVMTETMNIDRILKQPERLHVTNGHVIRHYKNKMGPVLIVTMHMGNWELGMWPIMLAGVRPAGVYRVVKNPYVDRYLREQRIDLYPGGLFGSRRAIIAAIGMLLAG
jgi:KDO2-lipid IV(A) lauroyltransferase